MRARVRVVSGGSIVGEHGTRIFLLSKDGSSEIEITDLVSEVDLFHAAGHPPELHLVFLAGAAEIYAERASIMEGEATASLAGEHHLEGLLES
jgi:hypothetical protein